MGRPGLQVGSGEFKIEFHRIKKDKRPFNLQFVKVQIALRRIQHATWRIHHAIRGVQYVLVSLAHLYFASPVQVLFVDAVHYRLA